MEETDPQETTSSNSKKGMNPMMIVIVIIILLVLAGGAYALMNSKTQAPNTPTTNVKDVQPTQNVPSPASSTSGAIKNDAATSEKTIEVNGQKFSYTPVAIIVKKGDKVTINFKNVGGFHDFVIDEFNVKTETIGNGKTATVSFTADKAGTFEYYCSVGNHRAMGMKGTLTVTP